MSKADRIAAGRQKAAGERRDEFLKDLAKLTQKHGFAIGGCGCCGSPFVLESKQKPGHYTVTENGDNLTWSAK